MIPPSVQCTQCLHFRGFRTIPTEIEVAGAGIPYCDSFPRLSGIPDEIYDGEFDHRNPHPFDNGIRFEEGAPMYEGGW